MSEEQKEKEQVIAARNLAVGEITLEKFLDKAPNRHNRWTGLKNLKQSPYLWNQLLLKLPVHLRLKALLDAEGISFEQLKKDMGITNPDHYINNAKFVSSSKGIPNTAMKLAIVFDVPIKYLLGPNHQRFDSSGFHEYPPITDYIDVINWTIKEIIYRNIKGFTVDNSTKVLPFLKGDEAFVRVDKNVGFFCVEIFLTSHSEPSVEELERLISHFNGLVDSIYIVDSLLRNTPKLTLVGTYKKEISEHLKQFKDNMKSQPRSEKIYPF